MPDAFVNVVELGDLLRRSKLDSRKAALSIEIASGWLYGPAGRPSPWPPSPMPIDLWAAHFELASMVYSNPLNAERLALGQLRIEWGTSAAKRAEAIIDQIRQIYQGSGPAGCFPTAASWPDPAERTGKSMLGD